MATVLDIVEAQRPDVIKTQPFGIIAAQRVWGTFESLREHLFNQFQNIPFNPQTGLSLGELQREVETYLEIHPDQPKVLQKANIYRIVVTQGQLYLDPFDWFADKLNHGGLVTKVRNEWYREAKAGAIKTEASWFEKVHKIGLIRGGLDMGHISPGWENLFSGGLTGLIEQAKKGRERLNSKATNEQLAFYEAVEIVYRATIALAERFAELAQKMILDFPEHEARLRAVADVCRRVPAYAPETFHEALQFAWLMHEMIEMEGELVRSMGHFDRIFYPYYRADIDSGRLTRGQAKELIKFFWFKYHARTRGAGNGKNFVFAGQYADGSVLTNELTYLALEAYEELNTPDPKLSVRFLPETPDKLYGRVADLIRRGHNSFVLMNDIPAVAAQVKRGKTWEDARAYLPIGCYEPAVDGKEAACTMNIEINLAKVLELTLHDGFEPLRGEQIGIHTGDPREFKNFEQMFDAYTKQMDFLLTRTVEYVAAHERQWPQINPSPLIAGTIDDCLAQGKDIGQGGAHYNAVGCVGIGLANACDSLLGVKKAVFDEKRFTMAEILDAIRCDFEGYEPMRQYLLNKVPKWGNNDPQADAMGKRIADYYCDKVHTFTNARGGPVQAALFTLTTQWTMGKVTGALPDGRKARASLAPGVGSTPGRDMNGVTGLIGSVTKLDFTETPNGSVLDVMLHPTAVKGDAGLDAFVTLIKTFFDKGGYALQFNVFDVETLRDAQRHPELYASLQIRVTGWSVHFTKLSKFEQDQFIARNIHTT
ncbi:MAG: pyruvate formate lyase family protein [Candidatus Poribacteria bacterium]